MPRLEQVGAALRLRGGEWEFIIHYDIKYQIGKPSADADVGQMFGAVLEKSFHLKNGRP